MEEQEEEKVKMRVLSKISTVIQKGRRSIKTGVKE